MFKFYLRILKYSTIYFKIKNENFKIYYYNIKQEIKMSKQTTFESVINEIRNILRKDGITAMDSINHCILFVIARWLTVEKCEKLHIPVEYAFENIIRKKDADEELEDDDGLIMYPRFYKKNSPNCLVYHIAVTMGYGNIKYKVHNPDNLASIIDVMKKIDLEHLDTTNDIIGTIYELHLKTGSSNARDLGQYFTDRRVIKFMVELCQPECCEDGIIERIVDPTMGTAGFLTMAIKYLNDNNDIDWKKNINRIYGFDIDDTVKNMGNLNIWLETGEIPKNVVKCDTLSKGLLYRDDRTLDKADVILANMPYGIKNIIHAECCEKVKELKIRGTKSEPLFLQLFMESLAEGGRCAVVVPDGMLFNDSKQHIETRKYLMENYNLKNVISLNDKFFLNTGVKTSILFFVNNGKTSDVEFSELKIVDNKIIENHVTYVDYEQFVENNYTLSVNKYNVNEVEKIEGIEYKKLGEICDLLPTTKHTSSIGKKEGKYRFYNSSQTDILYVDICEVQKDSVIIGNGGNLCIHFDKDFTPSKHVTVCQMKNDIKCDIKYVYHYLKLNKKILENLSAGSTIQWLNKTNIMSIEIPIPSIEVQNRIVEQLDVISKSIEMGEEQIEAYKKIMKYYVGTKTKNEKECIFKDVCNFINGKHDTSFGKKSGKYKFHTGGVRTELYTDEYDIDKLSIIINRTNGSGKCNIFIDKKFSCATQTMVFNTENDITTKYIYYYFYSHIEILEKGYRGSNHKNISTEFVENLKILKPPKEKQEEIVKYCDNLTEIINKIKQQNDSSNELMREIINMQITV
jgi:type I restriction enzyme M protein